MTSNDMLYKTFSANLKVIRLSNNEELLLVISSNDQTTNNQTIK